MNDYVVVDTDIDHIEFFCPLDFGRKVYPWSHKLSRDNVIDYDRGIKISKSYADDNIILVTYEVAEIMRIMYE